MGISPVKTDLNGTIPALVKSRVASSGTSGELAALGLGNQLLAINGVFKAAEPATSAQLSWQSSVAALLGKDSLLGKDKDS